MHLHKKKIKVLFIIFILIVVLYLLLFAVLPNQIQYVSDKDSYFYNGCYYEKINDDEILDRIHNFNFDVDYHKVLYKDFPLIGTMKLAYNDNIILADNFVFSDSFYLKSGMDLPSFEAEEIQSLLIEYSDETNDSFELNDFNSIDNFIHYEMDNYKGKNVYVTVEYKNSGCVEIIAL